MHKGFRTHVHAGSTVRAVVEQVPSLRGFRHRRRWRASGLNHRRTAAKLRRQRDTQPALGAGPGRQPAHETAAKAPRL